MLVAIGIDHLGTSAVATLVDEFVLGVSTHNVHIPGTVNLAKLPSIAFVTGPHNWQSQHRGR